MILSQSEKFLLDSVVGEALVRWEYDEEGEGTYTLFFENGRALCFSLSGDDMTCTILEQGL